MFSVGRLPPKPIFSSFPKPFFIPPRLTPPYLFSLPLIHSCMLVRMAYYCASQVTAATLKGEALLPPDSPATERTTMTVSRHYSRRSTTTTTATPRRGDHITSSQNKVESVSRVETLPTSLPHYLKYLLTHHAISCSHWHGLLFHYYLELFRFWEWTDFRQTITNELKGQ